MIETPYPEALIALFALALAATSSSAFADEARLGAAKYGENVFLRSAFSPREDLVIQVGKGSNGQSNFAGVRLVDASAGMSESELSGGRMIHGNGDDSTPWNINGTYIGANHGCSDTRELTCKGHGLKAADLGSEWEDEAEAKFYLIKIVDEDRLWFLSENTGKGDIWQFNTKIAGSRLARKDPKGTLAFSDNQMAQLRPACRIKTQEYLIEGKKPLKDGKTLSCDFLDIVEDYDIVSPASLLEDIIKNRGEERDFVADHLKGVIHNRIVYRFFPNGANVIDYTAEALQEFRLGYMGFIQSAKLAQGEYATLEYYIPKTTPFVQDGIAYDFRGIQDYSGKLPSPVRFSEANKNIEDPKDLPDRFIQFLGRKENGKTVYEVGYALGYSLLRGMTQPPERAKNTSYAINLHTTSKSYPAAIDGKMCPVIPKGRQFHCIAYRQYFCPAAQKNATCLYGHEEDGETVLYVDYHKAADHDMLELPRKLKGKRIKVVEKTPSLTLHTKGKVTGKGVEVSVKGDYGYVVLVVK